MLTEKCSKPPKKRSLTSCFYKKEANENCSKASENQLITSSDGFQRLYKAQMD